MTARRLGLLATVTVVALLVLGTGMALGAGDDTGQTFTGPDTAENVSAAGAEDLTVVDFNWPTTCPDEGTDDSVLNEYFDGDIGPSNDEFHLDNAGDADDDPPTEGCVLRTEGENASIVSMPGGQLNDINYYPQRGDSISWNHYVHNINPGFGAGSYPSDFEFRFGVQDANNYYFVTVEADETPLEFVLGEVSNGAVVAEDRVNIDEKLDAATFQPVEVDWSGSTIEAIFDGVQTVSIDSSSYDDGGIGFQRQGTQGTPVSWSYTNLVDSVTADTASHLQIQSLDFPETIAPDEDLTVGYTLTNEGEQTATESEVGLFVGPEKKDTDLDVTVAPGETESGTLTFESAGEFEENETIGFTVELADWNDVAGGSTDVAEPPEFVLTDVTAPDEIKIEQNFTVDYVVENVGGESYSSFVELTVDGESGFADFNDATLDPNESVGGTLVYDNVSGSYDGGDTLEWTVGFSEFEDNVTGTTEVLDPPEFVLTDVTAPDTIGIEEDLAVEYEITNEGGQQGTESFVDLYVDGEFTDTDQNITLVPGETESGTLTFGSVDENYEGGEVIDWTVELYDFGDSVSGQTNVTEGPVFELTSIDPPEEIGLNEDLVFNYTVENTGDVRGTESAVELLVDGSLADVDEDLLLLPGKSTNGTLVFDSISAAFGPGEKVPLTVGLSDFDDSLSAETDITEADGPGELYFTVDPPNPKAGDSLHLQAGHYNSSKYYFWLVGGEEIASGTSATTVIKEPGTYNITLVESDIPTSPFVNDANTQVFNSVTKQVELGEGDLVVSDTHLQGFTTPIFPELEEERPVELTIETTEDQEFESVSVTVNGVTTPLVPTDTFGATRTYTGTVNVANVQEDTEATVNIEAFGASYSDTKQVAVRDTPDWLGTVLEYGEQYGPIEETEGGYSLTLDLFDTTFVVDSGTSPYWDEDINVTLAGSGTFAITPDGMDLSADVTGGGGIAGTYATAGIEPSAEFGYNLSLLEAETVTSIMLERDLFQQDIGLDPLYENLPSPVADKLPSCVVGAEASVQGELTHYMQFIDGLHPFDDLEEMALEGQPTLPVGAEATCGPASLTLDSAPTAQAAVRFEPELPPDVKGAGAKADITVNGELEIDLWFFSGSESASWNLYSWEAIEGENPFIDSTLRAPMVRAGSTDEPSRSGLVRQRAGAATAPLSGVPTVDAGMTTDALSPASASDTTVRLTERTFDDTDPALADLGDEFAMLWSREPAASGGQEPSNLAVRVGSGTDWSDPVTITDNANHEGEPALATDADGSALAAWSQFEDANRDIGQIEDQFFQEYEIAIAPATDPANADSWADPTTLTDGDAYEYDPTVQALGDDQWLVVWDRNTAANLSDLSAEEVGYALVSTAGDGVTVETQGTIADARVPDVGVVDGQAYLAFHRPEGSLEGGQVVRGTFDPATGSFQPVETHSVSGFTDLAAAGDRVVWADGPASDPSISTAVGTAPAAEAVPLSTQMTRLTDLELATRGDRTVLTYQADSSRSESTQRDLFVQVNDGGSWSSELHLARTDLDSGPVTLSGANPVATDQSAVVPYVVSESAVDSSEDLFLVERPYEPTHALSATIDAPENVSVGDTVAVEATVENVAVAAGNEPATVAVTDGETTVATTEVGPLAPGETATVELAPAVPATGELVVTVDGADPATDDGAFTQTATETLVTPALVPGEVSATRLNESASELSVTIENTGEVDADGTTVALRDEGETVATAAVPPVAGEDSVTVTMTVDPGALNRSNSETVVLDPEDELSDAAIERSTRSVWAGQPDVVVTEDIEYSQTGSGVIVATVMLGNEGPVGTTVSLSALDESGDETFGTSTVELPPAIQGTTQYRMVNVYLDGVAENDTVLFDAAPVERPDADTGTTGIWDEVTPVLSGFTPEPVVDGAPPKDLNGDGLYRDIDGSGTFDIFDVQALFVNLDNPAVQNNAWAFKFDGDSEVSIIDVQMLFDDLGAN
jgi:subtilase family serine protease